MKPLSPSQFDKLPLHKQVAYRIITGAKTREVMRSKDVDTYLILLGDAVAGLKPKADFWLWKTNGGGWNAEVRSHTGPQADVHVTHTGMGATPLKACRDLISAVLLKYNEAEGSKIKKSRYPQNPEFCTHNDVERDVHSPAALLSDIPINKCNECGTLL